MKIIEIFHSLQGEGPWLGRPCVFIRLAGCMEPYCEWCDTGYALSGGHEMGIGEIIRHIRPFACTSIVITGGEPFISRQEVISLHETLIKEGCHVQYETSGKAGIPYLEKAVIVLSPKMYDGKWLVDSDDVKKADYFKFLYAGAESAGQICEFVQSHGIDQERIYIMPLGATRIQQLNLMPEVFDFCRVTGFNMTPRLHILCFDEKRGI